MKAIFETITFLSLILTLLVLVGRGIWQIKKMTIFKSFYPLNYAGLLIFVFSLVLGQKDLFGYRSIAIAKAGLGLSIFSLFAISCISTIEKITSKKVKTLLRIPVIGILLAIYLSPFEFAIAICVIELITVYLFYRFRETQLYCLRQQVKAIFGILLACFLYYNYLVPFYLGLTIYFIMKFQIANGVKLKLLIVEKSIEKEC